MNAGREIHGVYPWHWEGRCTVKQTGAGVISVISLGRLCLGLVVPVLAASSGR